MPILRAHRGGTVERLVGHFRTGHPILVFLIAMFTGLAVIAALSIGLGLVVTKVVEHAWGMNAAGEQFNVWLATHRTSARTEASLIGSIVAGGVVLPIIAGVVGVLAATLRQWRIGAFVVFALGVESATYRLTTLAVHSHRPTVARLENLPVNASYPSGHTAAAIAIYGGLALLITSRFTSSYVRVLAWTTAAGLVAFVAMARMYRGMHHPLDIAGGAVVGISALVVLVFACRAAGAVRK